MYFWQKPGRYIRFWQFLFILSSTSWLLAPVLNHTISGRVGLISQYEMLSQPYGWLFVLGDITGALLLLLIAKSYLPERATRVAIIGLLVIGIGMLADALLPTTCHLRGNVCYEYFSFNFLLHAIETIVTALAIFALTVYDAYLRKRLVSIMFVVFQMLYGLLFVSQLASQNRFNTLSQVVYQSVSVVWIAWYVGDYLVQKNHEALNGHWEQIIKAAVAMWAFLNGIAAILISLAHLTLLGRIQRFYFAGDNALLAQHSAIVGVVLIYLSRHLWRGERRSRHLFLLILGIETIKYSVIAPHLSLLLLYLISFCLLFVLKDQFDRGSVDLTWRLRLKDLAFMLGGLASAALITSAFLYSDKRLARITGHAVNKLLEQPLTNRVHHHLPSALLAQTFSAFLLASALAILWTLFKPSKSRTINTVPNREEVWRLLSEYASVPDDYFKYWPYDKQYFWSHDYESFITYKIEGPVVFALADPIAAEQDRSKLIVDFIKWARSQGRRVCFLPVYEKSLNLYTSARLNTVQIGSSALVNVDQFISKTAKDKWWRWQRNRAEKREYRYFKSAPPHSKDFLIKLQEVSDAWLTKIGRKEMGFAMGHFSPEYLQQCPVHYLENSEGAIIAFTNQLPILGSKDYATIDLLRHLPEANNAMSYLLLKTIENIKMNSNASFFDLGFVPFTKAQGPLVTIARLLSTERFSSLGLEQFKNKFDPDWHSNYFAYDGDLGDLALIALHLEKVMDLREPPPVGQSTSQAMLHNPPNPA